MEKQDVQSVIFKGMERINERINASEGACEEIVNLRPEGNTWRNVGVKTRMKQYNTGRIGEKNDFQVILHPASQDRYTIIWEKTQNIVYLYNTPQDVTEENPYNIGDIADTPFKVRGQIISVTYLDNILTICTDVDKYFYLWRDNKYIPLNLNDCRAVIKAEGITKPAKNNKPANTNSDYVYTYQYAQTKTTDGDNIRIAHINSSSEDSGYSANIKNYDRIPGYIAEVLEKQRKACNDSDSHSYFKGLSLYRVALELADGSFTTYSNIDYADTMANFQPYRYGHAIKINCQSQKNPHKYDCNCIPFKIILPQSHGSHRVHIKIGTLSEIKELMRIKVVKNISLFMTNPVYAYDINDYENYDAYYIWDYTDRREFIVGKKVPHFLNDGTYPCRSSIIYPPINKQILDIWENGAFYRVKTFNLEYLNDYNITDTITAEIYAKDIETLTANTALPTHNESEDNTTIFSNSYVYNGRQHLYDLRYSVFGGYNLYNNEAIDRQDNVIIVNGETFYLYYAFKGQYNDRAFSIVRPLSADYVTGIELSRVEITIPRDHLRFEYPMISNVSFEILLVNGDNKQKTIYADAVLNNHAGQNISFVNEIKTDNQIAGEKFKHLPYEYGTQTKNENQQIIEYGRDNIVEDIYVNASVEGIDWEDREEGNGMIYSPNVVQLTETNNALITPNKDNYSFGETNNRVIAIRSNTGTLATSERNFGTTPLYVFCEDGIYVMQVGSGDVAYSNVIKISNDMVINPNTLQTTVGIVYISEAGVNMISSNGVKNISERMHGRPTVTKKTNIEEIEKITPTRQKLIHNESGIVELVTIHDLDDAIDVTCLTPTDKDFITEIKDCQMYYNVQDYEVCFVGDNYTYVYNIRYDCWYKRHDSYRVEDDFTLSKRESIKALNSQGKEYTIANGLVLYSIKETDNIQADIAKRVVVITKYLMLDTRQYKHIERMIFNISWTTRDNFYLLVLGSNDGVNFSMIKKVHQYAMIEDESKPRQDYYLSRMLRSVKYIVICILSRDLPNTRIGNVYISDRQKRAMIGIR